MKISLVKLTLYNLGDLCWQMPTVSTTFVLLSFNLRVLPMKILFNAAIFAACSFTSVLGHADIVNLTPGQINGGDTNTASFSDGFLTLTPEVGGVASTFNASAARLGIDGTGTNANAFNDPDIIPNNGNEETLVFDFGATAGLVSLSWDFSRADGPGADDGIFISGFLFDPNATFTGANATVPTSSANYDAVTGTLNFDITAFNGNVNTLNLNAAASLGQSLNLRVQDTTQPGAQLAITGISYNSAVPEPASAAILGLAACCVGFVRRRR